MKSITKTALVAALVALAPIVLGAALYNRLPAEVATHWGVNGEVDGWSSKAVACFVLPLGLSALELVCAFASTREPRRNAMPDAMVTVCLWIIPMLSVTLIPITLFIALGAQIRVERIVPAVLGALFIVLGNYLPKCRQNTSMGIRLPWTLASEENWNRTHRASGYVWMCSGAALIAAGWAGLGYLGFLAIAAVAVFPAVYSFVLHKRGI